ncbi:MAG: response regulator [Elusimicrobia bacterium]|nr:response regulator [Elusimicrobiota bacterium]
MSARVLAVDDTPALRALLQLCLTKAGYRVDLAEDGQSAVEMFRAGDYAAVVMDIQMPVLDGLSAVALMRAEEKGRARARSPVLALTANTEPADLRRCLEAGFDATVRKPFGREELLAALSRALAALPDGGRILVSIEKEFEALIPDFLDGCRREVAEMRTALARGDYRAIAASSHKLIGSGASYGFRPLSDEGLLIETAAKASDGAAVLARLEAAAAYLDRVSVVYS